MTLDLDRALSTLWMIPALLMGVWVTAVERENSHLREIDHELSQATAYCLTHYDGLQDDLDFTIGLYSRAIRLAETP